MLAGQSGGQTLTGGTGAGENLTLVSTSDASKGVVTIENLSATGTANFVNLTTTGDIIVGGDLTVNGTTTTINTATLDVEDANNHC